MFYKFWTRAGCLLNNWNYVECFRTCGDMLGVNLCRCTGCLLNKLNYVQSFTSCADAPCVS